MAFGKSRYNAYRKRSFSRSDKQRREYAQAMDELEHAFDELDGWHLSNHSADNKYHDLENGYLIVNVKASKLNFVDIIENKLDKILEKVDKLDLDKYRFINATNLERDIKCYLKGYKTKKEVV